MSDRVVLGRLTGVFGVRGELKFHPSSVGASSLTPGGTYEAVGVAVSRRLRCRSARRHHERMIVAFDGIETSEAARELAGCDLAGERGDIRLEPGEFLDRDLVGLRLVDADGAELGRTVIRVVHYPGQDCLVVRPGEALVPLIKPFIARIDLATRTIVTTLPEGLFDED